MKTFFPLSYIILAKIIIMLIGGTVIVGKM